MFDETDVEIIDILRARQTKNWTDFTYLNLVKDVLNNGVLKPTRAKINGKNVSAYSVFGRQVRFDLTCGFPILTTKKVSFNAVCHELLWFLSGSSNIKYLQNNNVHIWDAWASSDGELGYGTYGTFWRQYPHYRFHQGAPTIELCHIDQIRNLINNINIVKENPTASVGRRLIVTTWHPGYVDSVSLPPCHGNIIQFMVNNNKLSCHMYQRSVDLVIGCPYNITSYALLTYILAYLCKLEVGELIYSMGDVHIYENLVDIAKEQLNRDPYPLPTLEIRTGINSIDEFTRSDFNLINYKHHGALRGEVAV